MKMLGYTDPQPHLVMCLESLSYRLVGPVVGLVALCWVCRGTKPDFYHDFLISSLSPSWAWVLASSILFPWLGLIVTTFLVGDRYTLDTHLLYGGLLIFG